MEEQQKNIDNLFRNALSGYREQPPEAAWQRVARHLDEKRKRRGGWFWRGALLGLALLAALSGAGWWTWQRTPPHQEERAASTQQTAPAIQATETPGHSLSHSSLQTNQKHLSTAASNTPASLKTTHPRLRATAQKQTASGNTRQEESSPNQSLARLRHTPPRLLAQEGMKASGLHNLVPKHSFPDISIPPAAREAETVPTLSQDDTRAFTHAYPAQAPTPIAIELPGYEPELPQDERFRQERLPSLGARPARNFETVPGAQAHPEGKRLPGGAAVSPSVPQGLAQDATDPIPLRKPVFRKSFSWAAVASAGSSSSLQGTYAAGIRAMLQLSQHIAVGMQPGLSLSRLAEVSLTNATAYSRSQVSVDSFRSIDPSPSVRFSVDTIYNYVVRETRDSIVVAGMNARGNFWEFNLPVLLRYSVNEHWYAYGGPTFHLGGKIKVQEARGLQVFSQHMHDSLAQSEALPASSFEHYFGKSALPAYSSYQPASISNNPSLRMGYELGIGYSGGRFMGEIILSQQLSGYAAFPEALRTAYSRPRVRFGLGYLIFDSKKRNQPLLK